MHETQFEPECYAGLYQRLYAALRTRTPLQNDCGILCGKACCHGGAGQGMLLFPGETHILPAGDWYTLNVMPEGHILLVCGGECPRDSRPLSCRIFPLFPFVYNADVDVRIDPLARHLCPLPSRGGLSGLSQQFVTAVQIIAQTLMTVPACADFLRQLTCERDPLGIHTD